MSEQADCRLSTRVLQLLCLVLLTIAMSPAMGGTLECDNSITLTSDPEQCIKTENCHVGVCGTSSQQCNATISSEPTNAQCQSIYGINCDQLGTLTVGSQTLDYGSCSFNTVPVCGNGLLETGEACDDGNLDNGDGCSDVCEVEPECTVDADCSNGLFCDGSEICNAGVCEAGTPPNPDDGVSCTLDSCDEDTDTIVHTPDDTICDNGLFCDGTETCDVVLDCQAGTAPSCDDGLFCTGTESCNEDTDSCESSGDPCVGGAECAATCQEDADNCFDPPGSACGDPADGECTNPDTCDGSGVCQDNHEPGGATVACGDAGDECTNQDYCAGDGTCTDNGFEPAGTACGDPADTTCDAADTCDGAGACQDNLAGTDVECRADAGACDVAEFCDGAGACPADSFEPPGTACGDPTDTTCDAADTCDGGGACQDNLAGTDVECRADAGACDVAEFCDGAGACPDDAFEPDTTTCGDAGDGVCDLQDTCSGTDNTCVDRVEPSTTECRADAGVCDVAEFCDGAGACPDDAFEPDTTECGNPGDGICDLQDTCSGTDNTCVDRVEPSTTTCDDGNECTSTSTDPGDADYCDGEGACDIQFVVVGGDCGDGSTTECTLPDTCDGAGTCEFNNRPCGSVTNSALCEFDVEPDKGTCSGGSLDGAACSLAAFDADCDPVEGVCVGGDLDGLACFTANGDDDCVPPPDGAAGVCSASAGVCEQSDQFRLLFTPDVQNWVAYKLNASNPGQTYYNMMYEVPDEEDVTLTVTIPWPYVTVGGNPLHVYDGDTVGSDGEFGCLDPEAAVGIPYTAGYPFSITLEDWATGVVLDPADDYGLMCDQVDGPAADGQGEGSCTFEVTVLADDVPDSGLLYVNLHLDFGLKGQWVDANPVDGEPDRYDKGAYTSIWGSSDALVNTDTDDGPLALADCHAYLFEHTDAAAAPDPLFEDEVENLNIFKQIAGAFGRVWCADDGGSGFEGYFLELVKPETNKGPEEVVKTATTDEDGYYALPYKHKGKPTVYTVNVYTEEPDEENDPTSPYFVTSLTDYCGGETGIDCLELQGNGWAEVNFSASDCDLDPVVWESAVTYGSGRNKNN